MARLCAVAASLGAVAGLACWAALAALVAFAAVSLGLISRLWGERLVIMLDVGAIGFLLAWSAYRAGRRREALEELPGAIDAAPIALVDADDRIVHWSRGCEQLYGWSAADALGRRKHELLASRLAGQSSLAVPDHASPSSERELTETHRDGRTVRVLEQARHVERPHGAPVMVLSITDIGARVEAEAALRRSEELLALASSAHQLGLFDWNVASGSLTWSAGSEQRLGLEPGTMTDYASWAALIEPDDRIAVERTIAEAVAAQADRFHFVYRFRQLNGAVRAIEGSAYCFYDDAGALVRTAGINLDITRHEEREAALRGREAQLRSILETVPDAMVVIDAQGRIQLFSAAAERMFGHTAAAAIGRNVTMLIAGVDEAEHNGYLDRYLGGGERRVIGHARILSARRADGSEFPIELRVGEAIVDGERLFTGFVRDISDRVAAEQRLNALRSDLTHVSRVNIAGEMAAALAHELNQPLAAVANYLCSAQCLIDGGADGLRVAEVLGQASAQTLRAGEIIRQLRDFISKRETGHRVEPVERALRDAAELFAVSRLEQQVALTLQCNPDAALMIANRVQIQQVLVNLLRNAFEALADVPREHRSVTIASRRINRDQLEISVSDSGPGLPPGMSREFKPFSSTKGEGGMGMGLSICRRIITAHGGELIAENRPEGGARFRFSLPLGTSEEGTG